MTSQKWDALSPEQQRVWIAEKLGWTHDDECYRWWAPKGVTDVKGRAADLDVGIERVPNWPGDLNACRGMEEALLTGCRADFSDKWNEYERHLNMIVSGHAVAASHQIIRAKPAQRCKAWALTMEPE